MELRPLTVDDRAATESFAARIPAGERAFLDRVLLSQVAVAGWTRPTPARRIGAFDGAELVGLVTVNPGTGWMSHVGEFRLVVQPSARGQGVGRALLARGIDLARQLGLAKLTVEVMAVTPSPLAMFESFGFHREAVLAGHVRDGEGRPQDLVLLGYSLDTDDG